MQQNAIFGKDINTFNRTTVNKLRNQLPQKHLKYHLKILYLVIKTIKTI